MIENLENLEDLDASAPAEPAPDTGIGPCPMPSCPGFMIEMPRSYSCSAWQTHDCPAVIWKEMSEQVIPKKAVMQLIKTGKTDRLTGFKSKAGVPFDAALVLENGRVQFFFGEPLGTCPLCQAGDVQETPQAYSCSTWRDTGCAMIIWKTIAKRPITRDEAICLINGQETPVLDGFTSRAGNAFRAKLALQSGKAVFVFDD